MVPVQLSVAVTVVISGAGTVPLHAIVGGAGHVMVGGVVSNTLIVAVDSLQPVIELMVPAAVVPHADVKTYLVFILYPLQLLAVGGVFNPHVTPSSKLY